ncbi:hypothetical protein [Blastopirellula marina]|uniref:hypothetical protein n=1 Tax=Blastopirellula marina TaxID=124 RepID=UPI001305043E|nr:hypothetical protein [Blastopirellula marina]
MARSYFFAVSGFASRRVTESVLAIYFFAVFFLAAFFLVAAPLLAFLADFFAAGFASDFLLLDFFLTGALPKADSHPAAYFSVEPTRMIDTVKTSWKLDGLNRIQGRYANCKLQMLRRRGQGPDANAWSGNLLANDL